MSPPAEPAQQRPLPQSGVSAGGYEPYPKENHELAESRIAPEESQSECTSAVAPNYFPVKRYKIIKELGKGGFSTVYLCMDSLLSKEVAVKVLHQLDSGQLVAFQTEARATSKLVHPVILSLLDFGPAEAGAPYMVLEYFDGVGLDQYVREHGGLSLPAFLSVFGDIISALASAHAMGIYHCDLKPSNILIASENSSPEIAANNNAPGARLASNIRVKLIDFGMAKVKRDNQQSITIHGRTIAGTPPYMAPDTAAGRTYDARSEIYSLGCVMFESLTGRPPFVADTPLALFNLHAQMRPPSLAQVSNRTYPERLESLVAKCLAKDPDDRFQSMEELSLALQRITAADLTQSTILINRTSRTSGLRFFALRGLLGALAAAFFMLTHHFIASHDSPVRLNTTSGSKKTSKNASAQRAYEDAEKSKTSTSASSEDTLGALENASVQTDRLEISANDGDEKAELALGISYIEGTNGVSTDYAKAAYWLTRASEHGNADAQLRLGDLYQNGLGVLRDYRQAFKWYQKSALQGNARAQGDLAMFYVTGSGVPRDYGEALKWARKSVAQNDRLGQFELGYIYEGGRGVKQSYDEAFKWYRLSAEKGEPAGQCNLGYLYQTGRGVRQNYSEAIKWYQKSSAQAYPVATANLGFMYEHGMGFRKNYKEALRLFSLAAKVNEPHGLNGLGHMYHYGLGVRQDYKKAADLYRRAADLNYSTAQFNLAYLYQIGRGVEKDAKMAIELYRKAAANGHPAAELQIGRLYLSGEGVEKDRSQAGLWLKRAAGHGEKAAQAELERLRL